MPKHIVSIGFEVPNEDVEHVDFDSQRSLLDADIVIFQPTLGGIDLDPWNSKFQGKQSLSESSSFTVQRQLTHWNTELAAVLKAGKMIVLLLARPHEVFVRTGRRETSGTGRNQKVTNIVTEVSSYDSIPVGIAPTRRHGTKIIAAGDLGPLAPYWSMFSSNSEFQVTIDGKFTKKLLLTKAGAYTVGAVIQYDSGGTLLLLPQLEYEADFIEPVDDTEYESDPLELDDDAEYSAWSEKGIKFGFQFVNAVVGLADSYATDQSRTPIPDWASTVDYRLSAEIELDAQIQKLTEEIDSLNESKAELEAERDRASRLRWLVYERGKPLEAAIREALELFGFEATPFDDGESEFDVVFESPEGRCLGEAEGKDKHAIAIPKLSQLERNIQEDFEMDGVEVHAKGVLFGNANRLLPPGERGDTFTEKVVKGAQRGRIALVQTFDMFGPAKYLKEHADEDFARSCREAIFAAEGRLVEFPQVPEIGALSEVNASKDTSEG